MEYKISKHAVDLTELAVGIILLGIVVSIGATIIINVRDSRLSDLDTVTTYNETVTPTRATHLANKWGIGVTRIYNHTTGEVILTGNYSVSISEVDGLITLSNATASNSYGYGANSWNVTYNWYNTSRADWKLADEAATGLAEYGNWFKIIVIVGVAAVVLSLIFMAFSRREGDVGISY